MYPYDKYNGVKPEMKPAALFHHVPGVILMPFIMHSGLYENIHLQTIAFWLLGGGFVSCVTCMFIYALDFQKQMPVAAAAFNFNVLFFLYCRWYQFPKEAMALVDDLASDDNLAGSYTQKLVYFYGTCMSIFNLAISSDLAPKMVRYVKRALDGRTLIETEPVPPSRESMIAAGSRRRSSMAQRVGELVKSSATRSSLSSASMMNPIEDVVHASNTAPSSMSNHDKAAPICVDPTGLDADDLRELQKTLSTISEGKKSK